MSAISAVLHFNSGAKGSTESWNLLDYKQNQHTVAASKKRDAERVKKAQKKSSDQYKIARKVNRSVKVRIEEAKIQGKGTTYEAGTF